VAGVSQRCWRRGSRKQVSHLAEVACKNESSCSSHAYEAGCERHIKRFSEERRPITEINPLYKFIIKTDKCTWIRNSTQRQARKLLSGPSPTAKIRLLSFYRTQSRVVTGLLTECDILRRYFYVMRLIHSPLCRRCGAQEETSTHVFC